MLNAWYDREMLNETLLDDPIFDSTDDLPPGFFGNIEAELATRGVAYPEFVEFPDPMPKRTIFWNADTGNYFTDNLDDGSWGTLSVAVESLEAAGFESAFDDSINDAPDVDMNLGTMVFLKSGGMVFSGSESKVISYNEYYGFLRLAKNWLSHQDDVVLAYSFIQYHPVFWHRRDAEKRPFDWTTDDGTRPLWVHPSYNDKGNIVVMMEIGSAIPPLRERFYREHRMDVWGSSFDDAYIQTAKKIHNFYYLDGSSRE